MTMIWVCDTCGSTEVSQGYNLMLPINQSSYGLLDYVDGEWDDYYWCSECQDDCAVYPFPFESLVVQEKDLNE